jgi:transcription elongation factor GreB
MNKAFTKDDDGDVQDVVPPRAPLPDGVPNYVSARGLALLREELRQLEAEREALEELTDDAARRRARASLAERQSELEARLASAELVGQSPAATETIRFGATVRVTTTDRSERTYRIVGVDEADGLDGRIAFTSPVARALIGKRSGDVAVVKTPHGDEELEVQAVSYEQG